MTCSLPGSVMAPRRARPLGHGQSTSVKSDQDKIELLALTELFGALSQELLALVAAQATRRRYRRGTFVFCQGDPGFGLYVVSEGLLKVVVGSEQGDEMVLVTLERPDTFGELALIDGLPRSASVEVVEPSTVLVIDRAVLLDLMQSSPAFTKNLLRSLGGVLRRLTGQASDFVFLDLQGRVAKLLVRLAEDHEGGSGPAQVLDLQIGRAHV
jgi:CRP/FNR family cyclic AMP-dependent transcriptional regulator